MSYGNSNCFGTWSMHNRENCGTGFSRKLQLVLVVILLPAFSIFSLSPFHRFEDWTAQHQADKVLYLEHSKKQCARRFPPAFNAPLGCGTRPLARAWTARAPAACGTTASVSG